MSPPTSAVSALTLLSLSSLPSFNPQPFLVVFGDSSAFLRRHLHSPEPRLRILCARNPTPSVQDKLSDHEDEYEDEDDDDDEDVAAEEYGGEFVSSESDEDGDGIEGEGEVSDGVNEARPPPIFSGEEMRVRVERLRSHVSEYGDGIIDIDELADLYDFPIDRFQRDAIEAFLRGSSVVVSAPTSSGKTLIAEAAAAATLAKGRRLLYTTPRHCPIRNTETSVVFIFSTNFGENNVGLLTGDASVNKDAQILIMTTEILRNMLYQSVGMISSESRLLHVDAIVLDEVHYLSDISRGTVWEEIVIYCPSEVQLICLSATVANPDELAGWISQIHGETNLITSTKRPVPLTWHFSLKNGLLPLLDEKGKAMNRKLSLDYLQLSTWGSKSHFHEDGLRKRSSRKIELQRNRGDISSIQSLMTKSDMNSVRRAQVILIKILH